PYGAASTLLHDTAPPPIYTLSLHDALPIYARAPQNHGMGFFLRFNCTLDPVCSLNIRVVTGICDGCNATRTIDRGAAQAAGQDRSEEHTSELQSRENLVCRLLLEKKKEDRQ